MKSVYMSIEMLKITLRPTSSEAVDQMMGPKQYPAKKSDVISVAVT